DLADGLVGDVHLVRGQSGQLPLLGQQVITGDRHLVVGGVPVQGDQLHPVQQRLRDVLDHVRRGQEDHVGQVQVEVEVVIAEGVVLRRVQHLQQGGAGVTAVVRADLVDLVQQHHRVER